MSKEAVAWAGDYLAEHGKLPGRVLLSEQFQITDHEARRLTKDLKQALLVPSAEGCTTPALASDEEDLAALWENQALISERFLKKHRERLHRHIYLDDDGPVIIAFPSDMHLGAKGCDMRRVRADQELIAATPRCYQVPGGDLVDNAIKHKGMMVNAVSTPGLEVKLLQSLLGIAGHRILGAASGNHDDWTVEQVGLDAIDALFKSKGIAYNPSRITISVHVGDQEYILSVAHRYRFNSGLNPLHAVQRMLERGQSDFHIGAIGHNHECMTGVFYHRGIRRGAVRTGSYQVTSAFSSAHGFNDSVPSCPAAILCSDRHYFHLFDDLREAVELFPGLKPAGQ